MIGVRPLLIACLLLLATPIAYALEIPIVFTIVESSRLESVSYSTGDTSSQEIQHTGTMSAQLTFDPSKQRATAILFAGADIAESPSSFTNTADVYIPRVGTKKVTFGRSSEGLRMTLNTLGSSHVITPDGRILDSQRLQSFPTAGLITTKITIDGRTQTQQIDVARNPPDSSTPSNNTELNLAIIEKARNGNLSDYEITFVGTVDEQSVDQLPDNNGTLTQTIKGYTRSLATFSAPSPFGQWLLNNGYSLENTNPADSRGYPLALLFAFRLPAHTHNGLPWSFKSNSDGLILNLQLPIQGLQEAIKVEVCEDLKAGDWKPLAAADFFDANSSLERGSTGSLCIQFPKTKTCFYRVLPASSED